MFETKSCLKLYSKRNFIFEETKMAVLLVMILILNILRLTDGNTLYQEGFFNLVRNKDRPNLPFGTDTNRYDDGFSSGATFEETSPHFPEYLGALANVSDRFKHYTNYIANCYKQGVAPYGLGDSSSEDAIVHILDIVGYEKLPPPNSTFTVYAAIKWNPSDFAIQEGETYNITVHGSQTGFSNQFWSDGGIRVNSQGYESFYDAVSNCYVALGRCRSHLKKKRRLATANWMSLVCAIGQFVRPVQDDIQPGKESQIRFLPLDESTLTSTIFDVGQTVSFRATHTGQLICFANDEQSLYWNNQGSLQVTATRTSWPPVATLYYQPLYLPACDSAQVVYKNYKNIIKGLPGPVECNPNGGGAGWSLENILSHSARFSSGEPEYLLHHN